MHMADWIKRLDDFLKMTGRELLDHAGKVSHQQTLEKAREEYGRYQQRMLAEPTMAEKDFIEATEAISRIEDARKRKTEAEGR